jgi:hypothetical protein
MKGICIRKIPPEAKMLSSATMAAMTLLCPHYFFSMALLSFAKAFSTEPNPFTTLG